MNPVANTQQTLVGTTSLGTQSGTYLASRTIGKITIEDIVNEVKFFENVVVCFVVGSNPPYM